MPGVPPPTSPRLYPLLAARRTFWTRKRRAWPLAAQPHEARRNKALGNSHFIDLAAGGAEALVGSGVFPIDIQKGLPYDAIVISVRGIRIPW